MRGSPRFAEKWCRVVFIAAVTAFVHSAHAQMYKCVGENGRPSFQDSPCPGTNPDSGTYTVRPSSSAPATTAASAAAASSDQGPPPLPNQAAKDCSERWRSLLNTIEMTQSHQTKMTPQGAREVEERVEGPRKADFLRSCARFGFVVPDTPEKIEKNKALSARVEQTYKAAYEKRLAWETSQRSAVPPPPSRSVSGTPSQEEREMHQCADEWESELSSRKGARAHAELERSRGHGTADFDKFMKTREQNVMARFLPRCGKYGFEWPRDEAGEARNTKVRDELMHKLDAMRDTRNRAMLRQQIERETGNRSTSDHEGEVVPKSQGTPRPEIDRLEEEMSRRNR